MLNTFAVLLGGEVEVLDPWASPAPSARDDVIERVRQVHGCPPLRAATPCGGLTMPIRALAPLST